MTTSRSLAVIGCFFVIAGSLLVAQTSIKPRFEVAAIKPAPSSGGEDFASLRFLPGGRIEGITRIHGLVSLAFGQDTALPITQIVGLSPYSGTGALRFSVSARPGDDTPADFPRTAVLQMLRSLLEDRFKLVAHRETRMLPTYALLAPSDGRLGPHIRRSTADCAARKDQPTAAAPQCGSRWEPGKLIGIGMSMSEIAVVVHSTGMMVRSALPHAVVDRTDLPGIFDLEMEWDPLVENAIMTLTREQLGLRLELRQEPIEVIVVDHIEPPVSD